MNATKAELLAAFTMRQLVDELIRRYGPDGACEQVNRARERAGIDDGIDSADELRSLADQYDASRAVGGA
jgi:hypothetical protein